jgi:hypothetical protein
MGADLYRLDKEGKDTCEGEHYLERSAEAISDGYFRDAYNSGSILRAYGLSWWEDIIPLRNDEGILTYEAVQVFRNMLKSNEDYFADYVSEYATENEQEDTPAEEIRDYFYEGKKLLEQYLDDTIKIKGSIQASL